MGSSYYWAFVAAITIAFAVVDLNALSRRAIGRAHGFAVAAYLTTWVVVCGLSAPIAPLGSMWWVFPAAVRIAVAVMFAGGQLLAESVRAEQAIAHPELRNLDGYSTRKLTEAELRAAEEYDAQWQLEEKQRNHELERREHQHRDHV